MDVSIASDAHRAAALLTHRIELLRDVTPVLRSLAAEIDARTQQSFASSRRIDGLPFPDLADSTKVARIRRRKASWGRVMAGGKSRQDKQREALRAGNYDAWKGIRREMRKRLDAEIDAARLKPLVDTGRGARSASARVVGSHTVRFSVVDYMVPHISGGKDNRPPQRNFSVFVRVGESYDLHPQIKAFLAERLARHLRGGL